MLEHMETSSLTPAASLAYSGYSSGCRPCRPAAQSEHPEIGYDSNPGPWTTVGQAYRLLARQRSGFIDGPTPHGFFACVSVDRSRCLLAYFAQCILMLIKMPCRLCTITGL
ncbi:hypothetical protein PYCCODRAFT_278121 [Trametes coccinea BRFM310]|uniref:Uncharacterized protein n=1 Tax=Trametes coccinea (strain BRFM310) TaxID=1353009 RepID=A0A1Y2IQK1_TRAC3|nr:hypothetical protein PYCCODRAFT_278121 [Trametes coccinea BRFM310]